jgi:hypothetical protein
VKTYAGDRGVVRVEPENEQRDAVAFFEFQASQRSLKSSTPEDSLGLIEVDLPEVGALQGVVTLEAHSGFLVYKTRAVPITTTD